MVPLSAEPVYGGVTPFATTSQAAAPSQQPNTSSIANKISSCHMDVVSRHLQERGLSGKAIQLVYASWTKDNEKQYKAVWAKWSCWCCAEQINPFQATPEKVAIFLSFCFQQRLSYSTLNSYRSAIISTLHLIQGLKIGEHPIISRCLECIFVPKPPVPK